MRDRGRVSFVMASICVVCLIVFPGLTSADEVAEEAGELRTETLQPGDNFVGWIEESITVEDLFETIPQIEVIYSWDAASRTWRIAAPAMPSSLWTLSSIDPGMAYQVRLDSDAPVDWQRNLTPAGSKVELFVGYNLVAWAGGDNTPIADVVKGIGRPFQQARMWNSAEQRFDTYSSADQSDDSSNFAVQRGEALWITVSRDVNWLQPTEVLPEIVFLDYPSAELQAQIREEFRDVIDFYDDFFGIQAVPSSTTLVISDTFDAYVRYRWPNDQLSDVDERNLREQWGGALGWDGGDHIFVKQLLWDGSHSRSLGIGSIAHEYFHALQRDLGWCSNLPLWVIEGTARWAETKYVSRADGLSRQHHRYSSSSRQDLYRAPTIESLEYASIDGWEYDLGKMASDRLIAAAGDDAVVEFFRFCKMQRIEGDAQSAARVSWRDAFGEVFGVGASEFYEEFEASLSELPGRSAFLAGGVPSIAVRLLDPAGNPVPLVRVEAIPRVLPEGLVSHGDSDLTDDRGAVLLEFPVGGQYLVNARLKSCTVWYNSGGSTTLREESTLVEVSQARVAEIQLRLGQGMCRYRIESEVLGADGSAAVSGQVEWILLEEGGGVPISGRSVAIDGSFSVTVPMPGSYRLGVHVGSCLIYHGKGGATKEVDSAHHIEVTNGDVTGIQVRMSGELASICGVETASGRDSERREARVSGRLLDAAGRGVSDLYVQASGGDGYWPYGATTNWNGYFEITVPTQGSYRLRYYVLSTGCSIDYGRDGPIPTNRYSGTRIEVADADVTGIQFRLPEDPASFCD